MTAHPTTTTAPPPAPPPAPRWLTTRFELDLSRARVMGIVNVTPDSFADGGLYQQHKQAITHCERLLREGAEVLDIGGESTRPGSAPVSAQVELERVLPVLRAALTLGVVVSLDTCKADVMRVALDLGVDVINDIWALRQPGALDAVAAHPRCGVCLMHMHGEPSTMQLTPMAGDALTPVAQFLRERAAALQARGVQPARVALDPGIGFGKTVQQNLTLLARQPELLCEGHPLLIGWSRKSTLGAITGLPVNERLSASVAAALLAVQRGAHIVRVHDVGPTVAALKVWAALQNAPSA